MSVSFPTFRYDASKVGDVVTALQKAAKDISSAWAAPTIRPPEPPASFQGLTLRA